MRREEMLGDPSGAYTKKERSNIIHDLPRCRGPRHGTNYGVNLIANLKSINPIKDARASEFLRRPRYCGTFVFLERNQSMMNWNNRPMHLLGKTRLCLSS